MLSGAKHLSSSAQGKLREESLSSISNHCEMLRGVYPERGMKGILRFAQNDTSEGLSMTFRRVFQQPLDSAPLVLACALVLLYLKLARSPAARELRKNRPTRDSKRGW